MVRKCVKTEMNSYFLYNRTQYTMSIVKVDVSCDRSTDVSSIRPLDPFFRYFKV